MSISQLIRAMAAAGANAEAIALAVEAVEAAEAKVEAQRAGARERKRRQRANGVTVTGQSRDKDGTVTNTRPLPLSPQTPQPPPPTCEDITTGAREGFDDLEWPEGEPDRAFCERLTAALLNAGGAAMKSPAVCPNLYDLSSILPLGRPGEGPVCGIQADVLPAVRLAAMKRRPASIGAWAYFQSAIIQHRDARLRTAPAVDQYNPLDHTGARHDQRSDRRQANLSRALEGALAATDHPKLDAGL